MTRNIRLEMMNFKKWVKCAWQTFLGAFQLFILLAMTWVALACVLGLAWKVFKWLIQ
jgi:hypothetical protein